LSFVWTVYCSHLFQITGTFSVSCFFLLALHLSLLVIRLDLPITCSNSTASVESGCLRVAVFVVNTMKDLFCVRTST
jgi:hypothetical protein